MAKVITTIKDDCKTEVRVEGIPGGACRVASAPALAAIGGTVTDDHLTDEGCQIGQAEHNNIELDQGG